MKNMLRTFYTGYENIVVLSDLLSAPRLASELLDVNEQQIVHATRADYLAYDLIRFDAVDLIMIDVDSVGVEDASYLYFLMACFQSSIPVVMMVSELSDAQEHCFLSSGVLKVFNCTGTTRTQSLVS